MKRRVNKTWKATTGKNLPWKSDVKNVRIMFELRYAREENVMQTMTKEINEVTSRENPTTFDDNFRTQLAELFADPNLPFEKTWKTLINAEVTKISQPRTANSDRNREQREAMWTQWIEWALQFAPKEQITVEEEEDAEASETEVVEKAQTFYDSVTNARIALELQRISGRTSVIPESQHDAIQQLQILGIEWKVLTSKELKKMVPGSEDVRIKRSIVCDMINVDFSPSNPETEKKLVALGLGPFAQVAVEARRRTARLQMTPEFARKLAAYSEHSDYLAAEVKAKLKLTKQCPRIYGAGFDLATIVGAVAMEGRKGTVYVPKAQCVVAPLNVTQWIKTHDRFDYNVLGHKDWSRLITIICHRSPELRDMCGNIPIDAIELYDSRFTAEVITNSVVKAIYDQEVFDKASSARERHIQRNHNWIKFSIYVVVPKEDLGKLHPFERQIPFLIESTQMEESYVLPPVPKDSDLSLIKFEPLPNLDLRGPTADAAFFEKYPKFYYRLHENNLQSVLERGIMSDWEQETRGIPSFRGKDHAQGRPFIALSRGSGRDAINSPGRAAYYNVQITVDMKAFARDAREVDPDTPIIMSQSIGDVFVVLGIGHHYFERIEMRRHGEENHWKPIWTRSASVRIPTPPNNNNYLSSYDWFKRLKKAMEKPGSKMPPECEITLDRLRLWTKDMWEGFDAKRKELAATNRARPHDVFTFHSLEEGGHGIGDRADFSKIDAIWCNSCLALRPKTVVMVPGLWKRF